MNNLNNQSPKKREFHNKKTILINLGLLAVLILVIIVITTLYISSERAFYYSDYSNYSNQTSDLVSAFRTSVLQGIRVLRDSLSTQYNKLPCLPLVPFILIFGDSRLVYILSCTLVYLLPFALVMGTIATKIIPVYSRAVFWATAFLALLIPTPWVATLRGYPDIGAAVIIGLAVIVYLKDIKLKHWWQIPLIGFLLALAILFRRHYAYSARAFLVAMILQGLIVFLSEARNNTRKTLQNLIRYGILISLVAISSFVTLTILAPTFIKNVLTTNYRSLYASYENPLILTIQRYGLRYGWLTWFLTILGFSVGSLTRILVRPALSFIVIFGSISLIQWGLFAKVGGIHHGTQFTLFVVLGLVVFIWTTGLILKRKARILILGAGILFLVSNIWLGLTPVGKFNNPFRPLFAASYPPLVRKDYDKFVQLIEYLREIAPNQEAIYTAAASGILNHSLLKEAEKQLYGKENRVLNILRASHVDSRDFYPIQELLSAQYVIVASPFQYHLRPEEQDVVKVVVDAFTENWEFAQDFKRLPEEFVLQQNVLVNVYQRIRPTSLETALQTLNLMQERIQPRPGNSYDWLNVRTNNKSKIWFNRHGTVNIQATFKEESISFLYFGSIPEWVEMSGKIQSSNCVGFEGFAINLSTLSQERNIIQTKNLVSSSKDLGSLSLSLQSKNAAYLRFDLVGHDKSDDIAYCSIYIKNLKVSSLRDQDIVQ